MTRTEFLRQTLEAIDGPRAAVYGDPAENHRRIADSWKNILGTDVSVAQVYACMIAVKLSRLTNSPHHLDSWLDIAAYAALAAETCEGEIENAGLVDVRNRLSAD